MRRSFYASLFFAVLVTMGVVSHCVCVCVCVHVHACVCVCVYMDMNCTAESDFFPVFFLSSGDAGFGTDW